MKRYWWQFFGWLGRWNHHFDAQPGASKRDLCTNLVTHLAVHGAGPRESQLRPVSSGARR